MKKPYILLFSLVAFGIHFYKAIDLFLYPVFWAEEGTIFFKEQVQLGLQSLWHPYAGYQHLFPRLIALVGRAIAIDTIPLFYHWSSLLAHGILIYSIVRFFSVRNSNLGYFAIFLSAGLPVGPEVYGNIPNSIYWLGAALPLLLFAPPAKGKLFQILDRTVVFIAGMSGPTSIIVAPAVLYYWYKNRKEHTSLFLVFAITLVLQVLLFDFHTRASVVKAPIALSGLTLALANIVYPPFFEWIPFSGFSAEQKIFITVMTFYIFFRNAYNKYAKTISIEFLLIFIVTCYWGGVVIGGIADYRFNHPFGSAMRYFYQPTLWMLIAVFLMMQGLGMKKYLVGSMILVLMSSSFGYSDFFKTKEHYDLFKSSVVKFQSGESHFIKIAPQGWEINLMTGKE